MNRIAKINVGVDVSKDSLDVCFHPIGKIFKVENTLDGLDCLIQELNQFSINKVVFEASGGYEELLFDTLEGVGYKCWKVRPDRIKGFIMGEGVSVKTDKSDAKMIALFSAKTEQSYESIKLTQEEKLLRTFFRRKQELKEYLATEKTRLKNPTQKSFEKEICSLIKFLEKQLNFLDKKILRIISKNKKMQRKCEIIESVPGFSKESSQALISEVPELGLVDNKKAAAILGTAPYTNESGKYKGKSKTAIGKKIPKKVLYMAAVVASRHNPDLKLFYERLVKSGKPKKVALVAVMRKLICLVNTLLAEDRLWVKNI